MRKIIIKAIIFSMILVLSGVSNYAAGNNTQIQLKIGDSTIKVNEDTIKVEKPYVSKGVTMVPLRIIIEAFGAKVEWKQKESSVRIINRNTNIKLIIGKAAAVIDGVEKPLLCAPKMIRQTTMVPMRFICESFGASVKFDNKTKKVNIVIPYRDYENRFRYITQKKIGDSSYGWSASYPTGCTIVDKQPSGTSVLVKNQEGGYYYYIYNIRTNKINKEEDLLKELLSYIDDEKVVSQKMFSRDGQKWADIVLESEDEVYEYRATFKNNRIYQIHFYTGNKDEFFNATENKKYKSIIDSFKVNYMGNMPEIRDINEIRNGLYTFREKNYGWSIDLPASVNIDIKKDLNHHELVDEIGSEKGLTCGVEFYSSNPKETLDMYVSQKIKELNEDINKIYLKKMITEKANINGISAKKIKYEVQIGNSTYTFYNLYLICGSVKYSVYICGVSELFGEREMVLYNKIFSSFKPLELQKAQITDFKAARRDRTKDYVNKLQDWSCTYPEWWNLREDEKLGTVAITDNSGLLEVYIGAEKNATEESVRKRLLEKVDFLSESENFKIKSDQSVNEKGMQMSKFQCEYLVEELKYYYTVYVFKVEDRVFCVNFMVADIVNSEANEKRLNELWKSFKVGASKNTS